MMDTINKKNHVIFEDGRILYKKTGEFVGKLTKKGYLYCSIDGKSQGIHRHIWEAFNGPIPEGLEVDHKFDIKTDNRLSELQLLTNEQNCAKKQKQKNNTSGIIGVCLNKKTGKWRAHNKAKHLNGGKIKHIGYFDTKEEAGLARDFYIINNHLDHHTLNFPSCRLRPLNYQED